MIGDLFGSNDKDESQRERAPPLRVHAISNIRTDRGVGRARQGLRILAISAPFTRTTSRRPLRCAPCG
jgi:hypothetical protein